jgi:hypothetical protein
MFVREIEERKKERCIPPGPPQGGGGCQLESQPVFNTAAVLDLLVRIPMLGLVNHPARRDRRIRGERPRRGRNDQRHRKNRPEDKFEPMWLKSHVCLLAMPDLRRNREEMCELRHTSLVVQKMQGRDTSACACSHESTPLPLHWDPESRTGTLSLCRHASLAGMRTGKPTWREPVPVSLKATRELWPSGLWDELPECSGSVHLPETLLLANAS